jgi:hypothetical protein
MERVAFQTETNEPLIGLAKTDRTRFYFEIKISKN